MTKEKENFAKYFEGLFDNLGGKCIFIFLSGSSKWVKTFLGWPQNVYEISYLF